MFVGVVPIGRLVVVLQLVDFALRTGYQRMKHPFNWRLKYENGVSTHDVVNQEGPAQGLYICYDFFCAQNLGKISFSHHFHSSEIKQFDFYDLTLSLVLFIEQR